MKRERIRSPHVAEPEAGLWSNCLKVGDAVYVSGMTARSKEGAVEGKGEYEQAKAIFTKIRHLVEAAGGSMGDVTKINVFMVNIRKNTEVWRARREFFHGDFPVSTLVEVSNLATLDTLVEIEAVAHLGSGTAEDMGGATAMASDDLL
jgi:2-iminobutanoate/2-iminopropanoate deaminase